MRKNERRSFLSAFILAALPAFTMFRPADAFGQTTAAGVYALSAGRLGALLAAVLGLIGVVVGGLALARPAGRFGAAAGPLGAVIALAAGLIGTALGGLVIATAAGGIGTGNGLGGAVVALVVGLIAAAVGGLAMARSHRAEGIWGARYQVKDVGRAVAFYTGHLGFKLDRQNPPAFAQVSIGGFKLILSGPGASGSRPMPDGRGQEPGGWNRIVLQATNLPERVETLKKAGLRFRNDVEAGPGGRQIQLEDPDGNPIELFEPAR